MSLEENYVKLQDGTPKSLQFSSLFYEDRDIVDPVTAMVKRVRTLNGIVTREDGVEVSKTFSITSSKLAAQLVQWMHRAELPGKIFTITKTGSGYLTQFSVQVL